MDKIVSKQSAKTESDPAVAPLSSNNSPNNTNVLSYPFDPMKLINHLRVSTTSATDSASSDSTGNTGLLILLTGVLAVDIIITVPLSLPALLLLATDVIITVSMAKVILTVILVGTMSMVGVARLWRHSIIPRAHDCTILFP